MSAERESSGILERQSARTAREASPGCAGDEDTALRSLSVEDRARLSMDAWEPSLLRKLLQAQGKLAAASRLRQPEVGEPRPESDAAGRPRKDCPLED